MAASAVFATQPTEPGDATIAAFDDTCGPRPDPNANQTSQILPSRI